MTYGEISQTIALDHTCGTGFGNRVNPQTAYFTQGKSFNIE
jgi:hypothetical protein